ncbi:MAG: sensor histidine kinase [Bacteroidales bacterium]|nr:sensor histidine kinase [Bacteroidales bacterium]
MVLTRTVIAAKPADTIVISNLLEKASAAIFHEDSALIYSREALRLSKEASLDNFISLSLQRIGDYYLQKEVYGKATEYYLEALKIEELRDDKLRIANLGLSMAFVYFIMEEFSISMDYYQKALAVYTSEKDSLNLARVLRGIGKLHDVREFCEPRDSLQKKNDFKTAISYFKQSAEISKKIDYADGYYLASLNIGNTLRKLEKPAEGLPYIIKAVDYLRGTQKHENLFAALRTLGICYANMGRFDKAISCYYECVGLSEKFNMKAGIQYLYEDMANVFDKAGQYKNARDYYIKYMILRDSVYNAEKSKQLFELERKYQSEKKEKEILKLKLSKKRQNLFMVALVFLALLIALMALHFIRQYRNKRIIAEQENKINRQIISELEKEKQLVATHAVLAGEESERRRLARDLHDGLGSLLTGLKLKLANMKGNYILDEENRADFGNALTMLDSAVSELRRVAHNLMPEALIRYGLKDALEDFCTNIETADVKVIFRFYGNFSRVGQKIETASFRIVQELVNNALKHAGAAQIIVQMVQDDNRLSLSVQDNGKGFDKNMVEKSNTVGLHSVKSRVASLNGMIDIYSEEGKGTEISIEFSY